MNADTGGGVIQAKVDLYSSSDGFVATVAEVAFVAGVAAINVPAVANPGIYNFHIAVEVTDPATGVSQVLATRVVTKTVNVVAAP